MWFLLFFQWLEIISNGTNGTSGVQVGNRYLNLNSFWIWFWDFIFQESASSTVTNTHIWSNGYSWISQAPNTYYILTTLPVCSLWALVSAFWLWFRQIPGHSCLLCPCICFYKVLWFFLILGFVLLEKHCNPISLSECHGAEFTRDQTKTDSRPTAVISKEAWS